MEMRDMEHLPRETVHLPRDMHIPPHPTVKNGEKFFSSSGDGRWRCGIWSTSLGRWCISRGICISRSTLQPKMMKKFFIVGRREMEMHHLLGEMTHIPYLHIPSSPFAYPASPDLRDM